MARARLRTVGRYEIVKHLASGGMADVLLARDGDHHVVLKRIRAQQANDERYVAMFLDEARVASALHHPNVVEVHDVSHDRGEPFFTMEYVHSEDVRGLLTALSKRSEYIPVEHCIAIIMGAAAGLHHAHIARGSDGAPLGIIHRDVSPANLLIGYDGSVKVADFGIAKARQRNVETEAGALKGKVAYMSPEQCVGEEMDHRSDVFSLGIVLYELLTVRRLFKGDNDFLTMTSIVLGHVPPPSKYRADLPPALEAILFKALENKPDDRYQTADALRRALAEFAAARAFTPSAEGLAAYMKQVFGARPMPWEDEHEELELSIDFDGSASGVVAPVVDARTGKIGVTAPVDNAPTEVLDAAAVAPRPEASPRERALTSEPVLLDRVRVPTSEPALDERDRALTSEPVLLEHVRMPSSDSLPIASASDSLPIARANESLSIAIASQPAPEPVASASRTMHVTVPRRRSRWLVGAVFAVVAAGAMLAVVALRSPAAPVPHPTAAPVHVEPPPPPAEPIVPPNLAAETMTPPTTAPPAKRRANPVRKKLAKPKLVKPRPVH